MTRADIAGVRLDVVGRAELIREIIDRSQRERVFRVNYLNAHGFELAHHDRTFMDVLNESDLVICDGYGIQLATRVLGLPVPPRLTPPDWVDDLLAAAQDRDVGVFLLGDESDVVAKCAAAMMQEFPRLSISWHQGFFDHWATGANRVIDEIRESRAGLVLVGMGMPLQEKWVAHWREALPGGSYVSVGALFRWRSGAETRAGRVWTDHGFEWLTRLSRHPVRHFRRYVLGLPRFAFRVLRLRFSTDG